VSSSEGEFWRRSATFIVGEGKSEQLIDVFACAPRLTRSATVFRHRSRSHHGRHLIDVILITLCEYMPGGALVVTVDLNHP